MRNWHPLLPDVLRTMAQDGVRRATGFLCAPHRSYSSCTQYRQNVVDARAELVGAGLQDVAVTYVGDWHADRRFIDANATHVRTPFDILPSPLRESARLVFTAHSIPVAMAGADRYRAQLMESAHLVATRLGSVNWALVFQSRNGRPDDPWLGPDVCDYLRAERANGLEAASEKMVSRKPVGSLTSNAQLFHSVSRERLRSNLRARPCERIHQPVQRGVRIGKRA